jgi:transcriptional regulator GlxA family with amidase domain
MDPRVTRVIARMEATLDGRVSLAELSALVDLSPSRMARLFTRQTGVPPARYLHQLRLGRARVLLERTDLSVPQILACVGLRDQARFARDFHRHHGVTPADVRPRGCTTGLSADIRPGPPRVADGDHET